MRRQSPRQKIVRFNNPKYNTRDKDIWPWLMAQHSHLTKSLHLLINVAQAEYGNTNYVKSFIKDAIKNKNQISKVSKSNSDVSNIASTTNHAEKSSMNRGTSADSRSSTTSHSSSSDSNGPTKMNKSQLKNAFLN